MQAHTQSDLFTKLIKSNKKLVKTNRVNQAFVKSNAWEIEIGFYYYYFFFLTFRLMFILLVVLKTKQFTLLAVHCWSQTWYLY